MIADVADGADALRLAMLPPDVSLLGESMSGCGGLEIMLECRRRNLPLRAMLLVDDVASVDVVKLLRCGGRGVLARDGDDGLLAKSIRQVYAGEVWMSRLAMAAIIETLGGLNTNLQPEPSPRVRLTRREQEVLRLIVEGESNQRIAARLSVVPDTVKHHLTSIFDKTGMSNRLELAVFAMHHSLIKD